MSTDYRKTAYSWAGPGRDVMVDTAAHYLHYNESLHMHDVSDEICAYCWLRAGRTVRSLVDAKLVHDAEAATAKLDKVRNVIAELRAHASESDDQLEECAYTDAADWLDKALGGDPS